MVIIRNSVRKLYSAWAACVRTDRISRTVSCLDLVESCCVRSPAGDDVSCAAVAHGGGCHFLNMTVPRAGTGNRESPVTGCLTPAQTLHVRPRGPAAAPLRSMRLMHTEAMVSPPSKPPLTSCGGSSSSSDEEWSP
jgi:hypothetical protein